MKKNDPLKRVKLKKIKIKSRSIAKQKDEDYLSTFYHNPFPRSPRTSTSPTTYVDITTTSPLLSPEKSIDNLNLLFGQTLTKDLLSKLNLTPIKDNNTLSPKQSIKGLTKKQIFDNQRKLRPKFKNDKKCSQINCKKYFYFGLFCHHCRNCGNTVCLSHGLKRKKLLSLGYIDKQRVCDVCYYSVIDNNPNIDRTPPSKRVNSNNSDRNSPNTSISSNLTNIINDIITYSPKPINKSSKYNSCKSIISDSNNNISNNIPISDFLPVESESIKINVIDGSSIICSPITPNSPISPLNRKKKNNINSPLVYTSATFIELLDDIKGSLHENDSENDVNNNNNNNNNNDISIINDKYVYKKINDKPSIENSIGYKVNIELDGNISIGIVTNFNIKTRMISVRFEDDGELEEIPYKCNELIWMGIENLSLVNGTNNSNINCIIESNIDSNENNENFNSNQLNETIKFKSNKISESKMNRKFSIEVMNETALKSLHVTNEFEKLLSTMNNNTSINNLSPSNLKKNKKKIIIKNKEV